MKILAATTLVIGILGLAGCAAGPANSDSGMAISGTVKAGAETASTEKRTITGSRIPEKPPRDRHLRSIEGEEYQKQDRTSVITHNDRPTN